MVAKSDLIICDGCGLPASPEHLAARVERLELATRFRPIHIQALYVALQPMPRLEDDFYRSPESSEFSKAFPSLFAVSPDGGNDADAIRGGTVEAGDAKLLEIQRRGHYLTYLSECPLARRNSADPETPESVARECISRLATTLVRRIRFNYKPKHIVILETDLAPLVEIFAQAGIGHLTLPNQATHDNSAMGNL